MSPTVSILFPVHNAVDTLRAAVQSILDQTYPHWRLLWIDDGSTDGSLELGHHLSQLDPRIHFISRDHRGIVASLQQVISHHEILMQQVIFGSAEPYLARMDADDVCYAERFAEQVYFLETHPSCDLVSCQVDYGGDRDRQAGYAAHVDWVNGLITAEDHFLNRFVDAPVPHPSVMFRSSSLVRYGSYRDGDFPEDYELWLRWLDAGAEFHKLPRKLMVWNDPPTRLSRVDSRYAQEAFYELKCRYLSRILPKDRPIWLWGAGRVTRQRFRLLETLGFPFAGFIDVDPGKIGHVIDGRQVISPKILPANETRHPKLIPVTGATGTIRDLTVSVKRALFPGEAKSIKKNISSADYFNAHIWNLSHAKASFVSSDFLLPQGSPLLRKTMRSAPAGGSFLGLHPDDSRKSRAPPAPNGQGPASFSPPGATATAAFGARQV